MVGLLLIHVPPGVASARVVVPPWHTTRMPVIATGVGLTYITVDVEAIEVAYPMTTVPGLMAMTLPVLLTVATEGS